jgi:hypothetical protein
MKSTDYETLALNFQLTVQNTDMLGKSRILNYNAIYLTIVMSKRM